MNIDYNELIITLATLILMPTIELIFLKVNNYLQGKIENATAEKYMLLASDIVHNAVVKTNQTFVDELKKNGEFTKEKAEEAFKSCKEIVLGQLTEDAKNVLNLSFNDYNEYINTLIEKEVNKNK